MNNPNKNTDIETLKVFLRTPHIHRFAGDVLRLVQATKSSVYRSLEKLTELEILIQYRNLYIFNAELVGEIGTKISWIGKLDKKKLQSKRYLDIAIMELMIKSPRDSWTINELRILLKRDKRTLQFALTKLTEFGLIEKNEEFRLFEVYAPNCYQLRVAIADDLLVRRKVLIKNIKLLTEVKYE